MYELKNHGLIVWSSTFQGHDIVMQEEDALIVYFKDTNMLFAGPQ